MRLSVDNNEVSPIHSSKHEPQKINSLAVSVDNKSKTKVELNNKELFFEQSNKTNPNNSKNTMIPIQISGKRETLGIDISPTNEEDWMLYNKLEETTRIDNNEIIKVNVEQYFKTIVENVENITKIREVIVRVSKGNETIDQYLSEDSNNCLVVGSNTTENNKCRLTSTIIQSSINNNNI